MNIAWISFIYISNTNHSLLYSSQFTITADFAASYIYGTSPVNYYSGFYVTTASRLFSVGELQMILVSGSNEDMSAESTYLELLGQASKFTVNQTTLTLLDAFNIELLIFSRKDIGLTMLEKDQQLLINKLSL